MTRSASDSAGSRDSGAAARLREAVARRAAIDPRALAALRIALGALLFVDLVLRARFLETFYTDAGVLPRSLLADQFPAFARISLHALSGDLWLQAVLFVVAGALALSMLVGYRTRTVTLLSWVLLVSLHARNPMVLNGGDSVIRRLVFWSVFLPLGGRWSVDALRGRGATRFDRVASVASAALLIQVVLVYATNAVYKHRGPAWQDGTAIVHVMNLQEFTVLLGDYLVASPDLLRPLGYLWLVLVTVSPLLLFLTGHLRGLLATAFAGMHLGMLLTMKLGLFPLISITAFLVFVPPAWWDVVEGRVADPIHRRVSDQLATVSRPAPTRRSFSDLRRWAGRVATVVATVLLVAILVWNAMSVGLVATPEPVRENVEPGQLTWNMFAPYPPTTSIWHVAPAELDSGERIDALQRAPVEWHPDDPDQLYPSARWRKYLSDLTRENNDEGQAAFAEYLCSRWNADHSGENRMDRVRLVLVREPNNFSAPETTDRRELVTRECPGG